eukprot:7942151-Alexandrium_andersonii.AAC.1
MPSIPGGPSASPRARQGPSRARGARLARRPGEVGSGSGRGRPRLGRAPHFGGCPGGGQPSWEVR